MRLDRRSQAFSLTLVLIASACGGGATTTATLGSTVPVSQATASEVTASEAAASQEPVPTNTGSGPDVSFVPGSASELEAMLPSTVNGVAFAKTSFDGAHFPVDFGGSVWGLPMRLGEFLQANGKTPADVSIAVAAATDPPNYASIEVFQLKGTDGTKLSQAIFGGESGGLQEATVRGKQVQQLPPGSMKMGITIYVKGDVVFFINWSGDASLNEGIVAALP